jgi:hypothetical protein
MNAMANQEKKSKNFEKKKNYKILKDLRLNFDEK